MPAPVTADPVSERTLWVRLHVRLAGTFGVLFAVLTGLFTLLWSDAADRVHVFGRSALEGLAFGIVMSAILGTMHWRAAVAARDRRLALDPTASPALDLGTRITRTVLVPLPREEILSRSDEAPAVLDRARIEATDGAAATITLSTATSWRSWGERIVLAAEVEGNGSTAVTITSRPRLRGTLVDYGRNADNVERLAGWLRGLTA